MRDRLYPLLKLFLFVLAVAFLGFVLARTLADLPPETLELRAGAFAAAVLSIAGGLVLSSRAWQALVGGPHLAVAKGFFLSQAGKYLPGGIWQGVGQAGLTHAAGVSLRRATLSVPLHAAAQVLGTASVAAAGIAARPDLTPLARTVAAVLVLSPLVVHPVAVERLLALAKSLSPTRFGAFPDRLPALFESTLWTVLSWSGLGAGIVFCVRALGWDGGPAWMFVSGFALAWLAGFLVVFVPAGVGVREGVLLVVLQDAAPPGIIIGASIAYRAATVAAELLLSLACTLALWLFGERALRNG